MIDRANVFNIPANYHFFESLFFWLTKTFADELSKAKIFLPNQRSCRELRELFLQKNFCGTLPQIKAISDISCEDFSDKTMQTLSRIEALLFLTKEIQEHEIFGKHDFDQAFKIAVNLKNLFDEIEYEETDLNKLHEIDDSNLPKHRQLTLEFLRDFYVRIKNHLLKQNIFFDISHQNFVTKKFVELLDLQQIESPMIIAGSTASIASSRKLIKAISRQKNGFVILHGLADERFSLENHPQFFLKQLVEFLEIKKIAKIAEDRFKISDDNRQNLISAMMLPAKETIRWQKMNLNLAEDLQQNFCLIEAQNEVEEAKIIASILQENANKKSALITNNETLIKFVKLELKRLALPFNDSRKLKIFDSKLIEFLLLILTANDNPHTLLAILKHPLCHYSKDQKAISEFEINVVREGIKNTKSYNLPLTTYHLPLLIKSAENLSQKTWLELLQNEPARAEIEEFFEKLKAQNYTPTSLEGFKTLLSQISYFEKADSSAFIQILSPIEARLLNFDCVIIASLNEGDFPAIEAENWLGKKIKKDLGIDRRAKKIGQNAYDFCNYLSNKSVFLTRCKSRNGMVSIESPFLLKFKTICKKADINLNYGHVANQLSEKSEPLIYKGSSSLKMVRNGDLRQSHYGEKYFSALKNQNNAEAREINPPNPKPKKDLRPKKFSITEISKLLADPYFIYAKKILQLKELKKIDYEPGYAEFGSFVHKALEEFIKNPKSANFEKIFEKYFLSKEAKLIWLPKFENIFCDFLQQNEQFSESKNIVEKAVEIGFGNVLLNGKIDRIVMDENNDAEIFDYKTGQIPSKKDVMSGIEPQLTIAALALVEEKFKVKAVNYWKLSSSSPGEIKKGEIKKIAKNSDEIDNLISAAKSGLERLFTYFDDEKNGYIATGNFDQSEYKHLARLSLS
ncbi:MAG: hypothetical protein A2887_03540 [Alphaproteobacteria bacterium RIFCSPLOWO2_01_FULL_40_26]|nr:MAG: hypothetical protein A3D15_04695 [Alphaproteobacteria bacterium RIFCSPHIGHO2_02_FULL_40_34]OFW95272.1 MAG: hypothetical protein A2887_03540 [Alphaproteobacteria bacterium RIFCSPLOWO2_01_FULL_40_26]OFX09175.1 MAG: hypothetical protein A3H30_06245 [Alphaproteobacteria bacterium RIFCSPLOWO2_02_FULL_40_19]OFX11531.1 MAG: hypothetical protein A3G22_04850 [Alphaproteobacteria bacterium RIFCSPLOWO2_12_FULL_40_11]